MRLDAARADQQVRLQARGRQRDQRQPLDAAPDQRPRRRHGDAGALARHRQHAAVLDGRERVVERAGDAACGDSIGGLRRRQVGHRGLRAKILPTLETGQNLENKRRMTPERKARRRQIRHHRGDRAAGVVRCRRPDGQGRAAERSGRCRQRHRRRRRPRHHGLGRRGRDPAPGGHRADPAAHLPRQEPHRAAKRTDGGGGARRPQPPAAQGRRSQAGRPARRQAGVRLRHRGADRGGRGACATRASCRPARRSAARRDFFIAAADVPIDPPAGWEPKSLKGKIAAGCEFVQTQFCMDAGVVRRYMARLAEHGVTTPFLIGISPLRSAKSARWMKEKLFGTIIPDATVARLEAAVRSGRRRQQTLRRPDAGARHHPRRCRRPHHGAGQRGGHRRCHQGRGGLEAGEIVTSRFYDWSALFTSCSANYCASALAGEGSRSVQRKETGEGSASRQAPTPHPTEQVAPAALPSPARGEGAVIGAEFAVPFAPSLRQRLLHPVRRERHAPDAHAGGVEDRVGDRGRHRPDRSARRRPTARSPDG